MRSLEDFPVLVIVFGMEGCHACEEYIPVFRKVAGRWTNCVPSYVLNSSDPKYSAAADRFKIEKTPTTLVFRNGRVTLRKEGAGTHADVEKLFAFAARGIECKLGS